MIALKDQLTKSYNANIKEKNALKEKEEKQILRDIEKFILYFLNPMLKGMIKNKPKISIKFFANPVGSEYCLAVNDATEYTWLGSSNYNADFLKRCVNVVNENYKNEIDATYLDLSDVALFTYYSNATLKEDCQMTDMFVNSILLPALEDGKKMLPKAPYIHVKFYMSEIGATYCILDTENNSETYVGGTCLSYKYISNIVESIKKDPSTYGIQSGNIDINFDINQTAYIFKFAIPERLERQAQDLEKQAKNFISFIEERIVKSHSLNKENPMPSVDVYISKSFIFYKSYGENTSHVIDINRFPINAILYVAKHLNEKNGIFIDSDCLTSKPKKFKFDDEEGEIFTFYIDITKNNIIKE